MSSEKTIKGSGKTLSATKQEGAEKNKNKVRMENNENRQQSPPTRRRRGRRNARQSGNERRYFTDLRQLLSRPNSRHHHQYHHQYRYCYSHSYPHHCQCCHYFYELNKLQDKKSHYMNYNNSVKEVLEV
ncbi:uncharacterized protein ACN427_006174 [Glossina fuscipes fuscipes]